MSIKIDQFSGIAPKVSEHLLEGNMAVTANNVRIDSGALVPIKGLGAAINTASAIKSIYKQGAEWRTTAVKDLDFIESPIANDLYSRLYMTSAGMPPRYLFGNLADNTDLTTNDYLLGIPQPKRPLKLAEEGIATGVIVTKQIFTAGTLTFNGSANVLGTTIYTDNTAAPQWSVQSYSTQVYKGGCALRFRFPRTANGAVIGLNTSPSADASFSSIDYAFCGLPNGKYTIYEGSVKKIITEKAFDANDLFEIEYAGTFVKYKVNGLTIHTSKAAAALKFYMDSSLQTGPSKITDIQFGTYAVPTDGSDKFKAGGLKLTATDAWCTVDKNTITKVTPKGKTATTDWDTGAYSSQVIVGDSAVRFSFKNNKRACVGINIKSRDNDSWTSIDFGIISNGSGSCQPCAGGVLLTGGTAVQSHSPTDIFEVQSNGTTNVFFIKRSGSTVTTFYTYTVPLTSPDLTTQRFRVDTSLYSAGASITGILFGTYTTTATAMDIASEADTEKYRSYVYSYVSPLGEEGPPSAPTSITVNDLQPVLLTFTTNQVPDPINGVAQPKPILAEITPPPVKQLGQSLPYNMVGGKFRIYRTALGTTNSEYLFVADVEMTATIYRDAALDVSLSEIMPSMNWFPPPVDMTGLKMTAHGFAVGYSGNALCPSEVNMPHAYNWFNQIAFAGTIQGLGIMGDSIIVFTSEFPYLVTGSTPDNLTAIKIDHPQTCSNPSSIVNMEGTLVFASPDGLVAATANDMKVITGDYLTREQWKAYNPSSMRGFYYEGMYIGFSRSSGTTPIANAFIFDLRAERPILTTLTGFDIIDGFNDLDSDTLYLLTSNGLICAWEQGNSQTWTWKSKLEYIPIPQCPGALRIYTNGAVTYKLYGDGVQVATGTVSNNSIVRLPANYRAKSFQMELSGASSVQSFAIANAISELS